MVVPQQPAQPVPTADLRPARDSGSRGNQRTPEPLLVPLPMVVRHVLVEGAEQPPLPEEDQTIEALLADRAHEPLGVGVALGARTGVRTQLNARALEETPGSLGPLGVPVAKQDSVMNQESIWSGCSESTCATTITVDHTEGSG